VSNHTPTFADLCTAIAEGTIGATLEGDVYQLSVYELRRYFNKSRSLPSLLASGLPASLASDKSTGWPAPMPTSVV
jgi:hypothetical protein